LRLVWECSRNRLSILRSILRSFNAKDESFTAKDESETAKDEKPGLQCEEELILALRR
jgi:hypothetical protein